MIIWLLVLVVIWSLFFLIIIIIRVWINILPFWWHFSWFLRWVRLFVVVVVVVVEMMGNLIKIICIIELILVNIRGITWY